METKKPSKKKFHALVMRKPLECHNGESNLIVPKDYQLKAIIRSYQKHGKEMNDLEIQADGNIFPETTYFREVLCDFVRFVD